MPIDLQGAEEQATMATERTATHINLSTFIEHAEARRQRGRPTMRLNVSDAIDLATELIDLREEVADLRDQLEAMEQRQASDHARRMLR